MINPLKLSEITKEEILILAEKFTKEVSPTKFGLRQELEDSHKLKHVHEWMARFAEAYHKEMSGWISVKNKPAPKDGKPFLAYLVGYQQDICCFKGNNDYGYFTDYYYKEDVTNSILYWQPLPTPPSND